MAEDGRRKNKDFPRTGKNASHRKGKDKKGGAGRNTFAYEDFEDYDYEDYYGSGEEYKDLGDGKYSQVIRQFFMVGFLQASNYE